MHEDDYGPDPAADAGVDEGLHPAATVDVPKNVGHFELVSLRPSGYVAWDGNGDYFAEIYQKPVGVWCLNVHQPGWDKSQRRAEGTRSRMIAVAVEWMRANSRAGATVDPEFDIGGGR